jgi:hypothetical protein
MQKSESGLLRRVSNHRAREGAPRGGCLEIKTSGLGLLPPLERFVVCADIFIILKPGAKQPPPRGLQIDGSRGHLLFLGKGG